MESALSPPQIQRAREQLIKAVSQMVYSSISFLITCKASVYDSNRGLPMPVQQTSEHAWADTVLHDDWRDNDDDSAPLNTLSATQEVAKYLVEGRQQEHSLVAYWQVRHQHPC